MTNTIGRVNFTATLDGSKTPAEAQALGRKAGAAASEGFDKNWSKTFRSTLSESGKKSFDAWQKSGNKDGGVYGAAFTKRMDKFLADARKSLEGIRLDPGFIDDFAKGFDDAGLAAGRLQEHIGALSEEGKTNGSVLRAAKRQVDEWAESQRLAAIESNRQREAVATLKDNIERQAAAQREANIRIQEGVVLSREMNAALEAMWKNESKAANESDLLADSIDKSNKSMERHGLHWRDLSHNQRQWTAIIGAVLAGMQDISVLGSAAGGGLIALGGAATSGVIGIGGLAAVFVTLNKELDELPAHLRPVVQDFQDFQDVFGDLRNEIATGAFAEMPGVFESLENSLRSLGPEFRSLGTSVGNTFDSLAENTREGSEALEVLRQTLRLAGPNFESMSASAGTFGVGLLRSFNRAQPVVEQFLGYLDTLANRFDDFSQSNGFDVWMQNTEEVFSSLGPLLDATGRMLNDLVTPESVDRTTQFLDNLTAFMPNLGQLLDMLGTLDPFGVLAQLLNDLGEGFAPLAPAAIDLAAGLSEVALIASGELGDALAAISATLAPLVQDMADFVAAVPPDVWAGLANGALVVAGAFAVLRGAQGLSGAVAAIEGFNTAAAAATTTSGKLGNSIKAGLGKAGLAGLGIAGLFGLVEAATAYTDAIVDIDGKSRELVASNTSLTDSYIKLNSNTNGMLAPMIEDWDSVLNKLDEVGPVFNNIGLGLDETGQQALALSATLGELDSGLATLAGTNIDAAIGQFQAWARETGATDAQVQAMLEKMPQFSQAIADSTLFVGELATQEEIAAAAMGEGTAAAETNSEAITGIGTASYGAGVNIDELSDKIAAFGEATFGARDAEREYEAAIDDLTQSLIENGTTLDITTEAGRNNQQALDDLAQAAIDHTQATLDDTQSAELARIEMEQGRQKLIEMAQQFGLTEDEAKAYADQLGLIPENVISDVQLQGIKEAEDALARLVRSRTIRITTQINNGGGGNFGGANEAMATGGIRTGPTHALIGEAGPEAVVPLDRPLNLVDPAVRWLSAIAQGKMPSMAAGGGAGARAGATVEAGAIVVSGISDPMRGANEVVQRLVENLGG